MIVRRLRLSHTALVSVFTLAATGCITASQATPDASGTGLGAGSTTGSPSASKVGTGTSEAGTVASSAPDGGTVIALDAAAGEDASTSSGSDGGTSTVDAANANGALDSGSGVGSSGSGYQINLSDTSVSGFSSGAFFAVQFHVAFSSIIKGAAIFAGGPYDCAEGSANTAETTCLTGSPSASALATVTKQNYAAGTIDNPANLANERVFLFGGADDSVVDPTVVDSLNAYYAAFMSTSSIEYESRHAGASHTMPTVSYGGSCDSVVSPYVGNCNYDGAGKALTQIYGALSPASTSMTGTMLSFPQSNFVANPSAVGLAATGYYYVPVSCANGESCRIHVSFHGCQQNAALVNDAYYGHAGYNEWADTNHIIVLYPQATSSSGNDYECWDFWGYDGSNYAEKEGTQLAAVRSMVGWLAAGGATDGGTSSAVDAGSVTGSGPGTGFSFDSGLGVGTGAASCVTATNTAQVAAGRAYALDGYAYATGSSEFLGADNASTSSSLQETTGGYYSICL